MLKNKEQGLATNSSSSAPRQPATRSRRPRHTEQPRAYGGSLEPFVDEILLCGRQLFFKGLAALCHELFVTCSDLLDNLLHGLLDLLLHHLFKGCLLNGRVFHWAWRHLLYSVQLVGCGWHLRFLRLLQGSLICSGWLLRLLRFLLWNLLHRICLLCNWCGGNRFLRILCLLLGKLLPRIISLLLLNWRGHGWLRLFCLLLRRWLGGWFFHRFNLLLLNWHGHGWLLLLLPLLVRGLLGGWLIRLPSLLVNWFGICFLRLIDLLMGCLLVCDFLLRL